VTDAESADDGPVPTALVAVTENLYPVPFVNPVTVHDVDPDEHVRPPGDAVTV